MLLNNMPLIIPTLAVGYLVCVYLLLTLARLSSARRKPEV
jgi:hypothetical protein